MELSSKTVKGVSLPSGNRWKNQGDIGKDHDESHSNDVDDDKGDARLIDLGHAVLRSNCLYRIEDQSIRRGDGCHFHIDEDH